MEFEVITPLHKLKVLVYSGFISRKEVAVKKEIFAEMCKKCKNYNKKYSCPPKSPDFDDICKKEGLFIILFRIDLSGISSKEYNKVQLANSVLKSRIDKLMRMLEANFDSKYLGSGSCKLCKPCQLEKNLPCKHPEKMRFSLEATGIDCNILSENLFKFPLLWYKDNKAPDYTCVLAGLPCNRSGAKSIETEMNKIINQTFY